MITAASSATAARSSAAQQTPTKPLDRDAFLQLLIAQLGNQDPLKPMDDTAFIAELAQFSSLEQMQSINSKLEPLMGLIQPFVKNQASFEAVGWIGRTISVNDPDPPRHPNGKLVDPTTPEGNTARDLSAEVESVIFTDDGPYLNITVRQKVYDVETGTVVERDVKKQVELSSVLSVQ